MRGERERERNGLLFCLGDVPTGGGTELDWMGTNTLPPIHSLAMVTRFGHSNSRNKNILWYTINYAKYFLGTCVENMELNLMTNFGFLIFISQLFFLSHFIFHQFPFYIFHSLILTFAFPLSSQFSCYLNNFVLCVLAQTLLVLILFVPPFFFQLTNFLHFLALIFSFLSLHFPLWMHAFWPFMWPPHSPWFCFLILPISAPSFSFKLSSE